MNSKSSISLFSLIICASINGAAGNELHEATRQNNITQMKEELKKGVAIDALDDSGRTPLCWALSGGKVAAVRFLINRGASTNGVINGCTPLQRALLSRVRCSRRCMATPLLKNGAEIDARGAASRTALMMCAQKNDTASIAFLMDEGADKELRDVKGHTALTFASHVGSKSAVASLVDGGARMNAKATYNQQDSLEIAIRKGHNGIVAYLCGRGTFDPTDANPLVRYMRAAIKVSNVEAGRILIKNNALINAIDEHKKTPLMYAVKAFRSVLGHRNSSVERCEQAKTFFALLVEHGAHLNIVDSKMNSPLHIVVKAQDAELTNLLLARNANQLVRNTDGLSPLDLGVQQEDADMVKILLDAMEQFRRTPQGALDSAFGLRAIGGLQGDTLHIAAQNGSDDIMAMLLEHGFNVNQQNEAGQTPLHIACQQGNMAIVQRLLAGTVDISIKDNDGNDALLVAARNNHGEIVCALLEYQRSERPQADTKDTQSSQSTQSVD